MIRRVTVMMLTARAGGQSKPMPRFRRQTRVQFKPSRHPDMFSWPGPDTPITMQSERTGIENKWFALTGRVVELKVEEDGDLHVAPHDVTGDKPGVVVTCRTTLFGRFIL